MPTETHATHSQPDTQPMLAALSQRVKGLRARRGISRRTLARLTGISDRYLARLEGGEANPSMDILGRIAHALDLPLHEIVADRPVVEVSHEGLYGFLRQLAPAEQAAVYAVIRQHFERKDRNYQGAVLLGLRGAGKSTLCQLLAAQLRVRYVRLRDVIEEQAGMSLAEAFSLGGQKAYRRFERQAIQHVIENMPGVLLEVGGSVVSEAETFNLLRSAFFTVWVKASTDEHMRRVKAQGDLRPIQLTSEAYEDLRQILAEREPYYSLSNYVIDTTDRSPQECADEIAPICQPYLKHADCPA